MNLYNDPNFHDDISYIKELQHQYYIQFKSPLDTLNRLYNDHKKYIDHITQYLESIIGGAITKYNGAKTNLQGHLYQNTSLPDFLYCQSKFNLIFKAMENIDYRLPYTYYIYLEYECNNAINLLQSTLTQFPELLKRNDQLLTELKSLPLNPKSPRLLHTKIKNYIEECDNTVFKMKIMDELRQYITTSESYIQLLKFDDKQYHQHIEEEYMSTLNDTKILINHSESSPNLKEIKDIYSSFESFYKSIRSEQIINIEMKLSQLKLFKDRLNSLYNNSKMIMVRKLEQLMQLCIDSEKFDLASYNDLIRNCDLKLNLFGQSYNELNSRYTNLSEMYRKYTLQLNEFKLQMTIKIDELKLRIVEDSSLLIKHGKLDIKFLDLVTELFRYIPNTHDTTQKINKFLETSNFILSVLEEHMPRGCFSQTTKSLYELPQYVIDETEKAKANNNRTNNRNSDNTFKDPINHVVPELKSDVSSLFEFRRRYTDKRIASINFSGDKPIDQSDISITNNKSDQNLFVTNPDLFKTFRKNSMMRDSVNITTGGRKKSLPRGDLLNELKMISTNIHMPQDVEGSFPTNFAKTPSHAAGVSMSNPPPPSNAPAAKLPTKSTPNKSQNKKTKPRK